jgi:hypothetical protein
VTRSATPASSACARAAASATMSRSMPSTVIPGNREASPIADQPSPQPTSATRAPAASRAASSGSCGTHESGSACRSAGRLPSPCAADSSGPYAAQGTPRPDRAAAAIAGSCRDATSAVRTNGSVHSALSRSSSGATCSGGSTYRSPSRSRIPATACCSSHSRVYRGAVPARSASSAAVAGPPSRSAAYQPSSTPSQTAAASPTCTVCWNSRSDSAPARSCRTSCATW